MNPTANTIALPEGHPIQVYFQEKEIIRTLLAELTTTSPITEIQKYTNIFNQLYTICSKGKSAFSILRKKRLERTLSRNVVLS